jgi:MFS transporter, DHA2 family, multidrug resistance protein
MTSAFGLGMFGTVALLPIMLESLMGYPPETTGLVMAPRGAGSALGMFLVSRLITHTDPRWLILVGLTLSGAGTYAMTWYDLAISPGWLIWPGAVQGFGMGMIFVPLGALAYQTIPQAATDQASSIFNLSRTIGASIGISLVSTVLSRENQINWNQLGGHITPFNPTLQDWLAVKGLALADPLTPQLLAQELARHAAMIAFVDAFWFVTLSFLAVMPLLLLLRRRASPNTSPQQEQNAAA